MDLNYIYQPLWTSDCDTFIITGGRGSAKSFHVSTFLTDLTFEEDHKILFTRYTMTSTEISIIPEFNDKINRLNLHDSFHINKTNIINKETSSEVLFRGIRTSSGNQTANLKSIEGLTTFVVDEAEEFIDEDAFDTIVYSIRKKGVRNRVIIIMNPSNINHWVYRRFFKEKGINFDFNGEKDGVCYIFSSYLDNLENLSDKFIADAEKLRNTNIKKYTHKFLGHWLSDSEHAHWKMNSMIDPYRIFNIPDLKRVVVGIDPSVSNTGNQDECGIVVCGMDHQYPPHFYCINDASDILSTGNWSKLAVGQYKKYNADRIVPEVNNGGDLVIDAIKNVDINVPCKAVRASRGKMTRAEPIAGLAEEGRIHHIGYFPKLEEQLTTYEGKGDSPGRYDAYVWAMTELSQKTYDISIIQL